MLGMSADEATDLSFAAEGQQCQIHGHHHGYLDNKAGYLAVAPDPGTVCAASPAWREKYCIDILTQVSAATSALQSVALGLLDEHLSSCVLDAARQGDEQAREKLDEASQAIARLVRS